MRLKTGLLLAFAEDIVSMFREKRSTEIAYEFSGEIEVIIDNIIIYIEFNPHHNADAFFIEERIEEIS